MPHQSQIEEFCRNRLEKLEKMFNQPIHAKMTLSVERQGMCVELKLDGNHAHLKSHGEGAELHEAIELAVDRMMKQVLKKKAKMTDLRRKKSKHEGKLISLAEHKEKSIGATALMFKKTGED